MKKNARQPKPTSTHTEANYRPEPEQFELLPPPEFKPSWPEHGTNPANALERLIAGERLTQPSFGLRCWRLAAYVKELDYLGWPIRASWVHFPGYLRPIKEYWLDQKTISAAMSLRGGAA